MKVYSVCMPPRTILGDARANETMPCRGVSGCPSVVGGAHANSQGKSNKGFADFDRDGKTDIAVYRPATGVWYVLMSGTNSTTYVAYQWGVSTDIPLQQRP